MIDDFSNISDRTVLNKLRATAARRALRLRPILERKCQETNTPINLMPDLEEQLLLRMADRLKVRDKIDRALEAERNG